MLNSCDKTIDQFFTRARQKILVGYHLSQTFLDLLRITIRKSNYTKNFFKQPSKDAEKNYEGAAGFEVNY